MKIERPTELPPELRKPEKKKRFPRARRWIFNVAAALSLLLFITNWTLWVRASDGNWHALLMPRIGSWLFWFSTAEGNVWFITTEIPQTERSLHMVVSPSGVREGEGFERQGESVGHPIYVDLHQPEFSTPHIRRTGDQPSDSVYPDNFHQRVAITGEELWLYTAPVYNKPTVFGQFGFEFQTQILSSVSEYLGGTPYWHLRTGIPFWFLALITPILPLWWLWQWAARRAEKNLARDEASQ